jgi:hypothetical protein
MDLNNSNSRQVTAFNLHTNDGDWNDMDEGQQKKFGPFALEK